MHVQMDKFLTVMSNHYFTDTLQLSTISVLHITYTLLIGYANFCSHIKQWQAVDDANDNSDEQSVYKSQNKVVTGELLLLIICSLAWNGDSVHNFKNRKLL